MVYVFALKYTGLNGTVKGVDARFPIANAHVSRIPMHGFVKVRAIDDKEGQMILKEPPFGQKRAVVGLIAHVVERGGETSD